MREHKNICGNFSCDFVWSQLPLWNKSLSTAAKSLKLFHLFCAHVKGNSPCLNISKLKSQHQKGDGGVSCCFQTWAAIAFNSINFKLTNLELCTHKKARFALTYMKILSKTWAWKISVYACLLSSEPKLLRALCWISSTLFRFKCIFRMLSQLREKFFTGCPRTNLQVVKFQHSTFMFFARDWLKLFKKL